MSIIDRAFLFAAEAHKGQTRWKGGDYFREHVQKVAVSVEDKYNNEDMTVAAYLHDVVEDTGVDLGKIYCEFGADVATYVDLLTRQEDQSYVEYLKRMSVSRNAILIKIEDVKNNLASLNKDYPNRKRDAKRKYEVVLWGLALALEKDDIPY